eukprot:XP_014032310.1 PREDICTED: upstream stimulatory factor 2-like [Salmo salar]
MAVQIGRWMAHGHLGIRRAQHNEMERRRRDKINNRIITFSKIILDCNMDSTKTGAKKGGILSKVCDYFWELRQNNQRLQDHFKEMLRVQADNRLLKQQVHTYTVHSESIQTPSLFPHFGT